MEHWLGGYYQPRQTRRDDEWVYKNSSSNVTKNGAKIKRVRGDRKDDKHPSIKQLLKSIKNTRRRLQKNLGDEERAHLISVLGELHEQVNREELKIVVEKEESLSNKGKKSNKEPLSTSISNK